MKIKKLLKKNKGIVYVVIFALLIAAGLFLKYQKNIVPGVITDTPLEEAPIETVTPISIKSVNIKEENFSGKKPIITGSSKLAMISQAYIDGSVDEFRKQANIDVPDMREKFGADAPPAHYTIEIEAKEVTGPQTDSIVISLYLYTGGANGNSLYKVITASKETGEILSLSQVIQKDKQAAFTTLVKKELNTWKPNGSEGPVVFPEEVKNLTFGSFSNWSLDSKNLIIYFSKYEVGPGVLGPVAFPISLSKLKGFLNSSF